jgi:hypothetical protein
MRESTTPVASRGRDRSCAWCAGPIPAGARRDAVCCSKRCRQARHRFTTGVGVAPLVSAGTPRRLGYADPPYPGRARRYYGDHPDYAGEVDHAELVASLSADYDAWALSTAADALQDVLAVCPPGVRVAAWHRGARPHKTATGPINAWEPVIYGGRFRRAHQVDASCPTSSTRRGEQLDPSCGSARRVDSFVFAPAARTTDPGRVVGAKPAAFWRWVFELLGATPADSFVDVFPASGGGSRAWDVWCGGDASRLATVGHDA